MQIYRSLLHSFIHSLLSTYVRTYIRVQLCTTFCTFSPLTKLCGFYSRRRRHLAMFLPLHKAKQRDSRFFLSVRSNQHLFIPARFSKFHPICHLFPSCAVSKHPEETRKKISISGRIIIISAKFISDLNNGFYRSFPFVSRGWLLLEGSEPNRRNALILSMFVWSGANPGRSVSTMYNILHRERNKCQFHAQCDRRRRRHASAADETPFASSVKK